MIADAVILAIIITGLAEWLLAARRDRRRRDDIERAYLAGVHNANRVHAAIAADYPRSDARH